MPSFFPKYVHPMVLAREYQMPCQYLGTLSHSQDGTSGSLQAASKCIVYLEPTVVYAAQTEC